MWTLKSDFQVFNEGDINCDHSFVIRANMEPFSDNKETKVHYKICSNCGRLEKKFETPMPKEDFEGMYEKFYKTSISENLIGTFSVGEVANFEISVQSNDDRVLGSKSRIKFSMVYETRDSQQRPFTISMLNEKNGLYEAIPFNPDAVYWFGPTDGFPLATRKYFFKIKFNTNGVYNYTIDLVRLKDQKVLATHAEELNIAVSKS